MIYNMRVLYGDYGYYDETLRACLDHHDWSPGHQWVDGRQPNGAERLSGSLPSATLLVGVALVMVRGARVRVVE